MKVEVKQLVPVKYYDLAVTFRANCILFNDSTEVEDIEWDSHLFSELENDAIEEVSESALLYLKFIKAYHDSM